MIPWVFNINPNYFSESDIVSYESLEVEQKIELMNFFSLQPSAFSLQPISLSC